jgi:hypothetical protein
MDDVTFICTVTLRSMGHGKPHLVKVQCRSVAIIRPTLQLTGHTQQSKDDVHKCLHHVHKKHIVCVLYTK